VSTSWLVVLVALIAWSNAPGEDSYAAWSAGRPSESLPNLYSTATTTDRWDAWLDLGLCAIAAERRGPALVWLLEAQRRAPARPEPRQALAALGTPLPDGYTTRIGLVAALGSGTLALPFAAFAGILIGYSILGRRGRWLAAILGCGTALALSPGLIASWLDGRQHWVGTATDTQLLDSTGAPLRAIAAGTIAERLSDDVWSGRITVRLGDGTQGWLIEADTHAAP